MEHGSSCLTGNLGVCPTINLAEQFSDGIILDDNEQIGRRDRHVRMPDRISDFGERPSPRQRMRDERVAAVVNREHLKPLRAEYPARRPKPFSQRVSRKWLVVVKRRDELFVVVTTA